MEVGLKKESPITYSNGKRLFTIDQKVDALVRIKMTGCSKAEVARSLHVAESTFRGWFKNKDIVMKAEAKYNEMKTTKSSSASSDGYKSDDNSKPFSVDGSDNNSSTFTDDRENSRSRFSSPDLVARRSPERRPHHHKQKLKKRQQPNGGLQSVVNNNNNNNNNNNTLNSNNNNNNNPSNHIGLNGGGLAGVALNGVGFGAGAGLGAGLNGTIGQQQLQQHLKQLAHQNLSSLGGLKGTNAAAAFAAAAAMAAAATASDPANLKLSPAEIHSKLNSYFNPSPLLATSLPGSINFLPPNFTTAENSYNKSSSFINTMVTATLMEPQALDLSTHSRNKCKDTESSLTANAVTTTTTTTTAQTGPKILRHNSYRKLFKPYKSRCTDDVVHTRQGINPRNPLWPLQ